jgi:outer membrane receptor protein involved in Fe transport
VRPAEKIAIAMLMVAAAGSAQAAPRIAIDLPAGTLGEVAIRLAQSANVTIGISDPSLVRLATPAVRGRFEVAQALARLLRNLPARAEQIDVVTWRIVAAKPLPVVNRAREPEPQPVAAAGSDVVVTGSKTGTLFDRYAGTATLLTGSEFTAGERATGSDALVQRLPTVLSTHLGPGRNKLFIRGVADSSFNGPSQAVVGEYLGDVRLNYNAPDPDISLYDVRAVEVIEGPQGTLYGVGALGGIVRIVPEPVDLRNSEASVAFDAATTAHGGTGYDAVGLVNLPLVSDRLGLRVLGFKTVESGYIDDAGRGLSNVNRTKKNGGRATLSFRPGAWRVEAGLLLQNIESADGQYAERSFPRLARSNRVAQPFDNDYLLAHLSVARDWGATSFVSASAFVRHGVNSRFDFTTDGAVNPRVFDQANHIHLLSNETRLSRQDRDGQGWVVGASFLYDRERLTRAIGMPAAPTRILGLSNSVTQGALFGEAGLMLLPGLVATAGARVEYAHLVGEPLDRPADVGEPRRDDVAMLPSLSLSWRVDPRWMLFTRYQEGLRPGGLSVIPSQSGPPTVQRFHGDSLSSIEGGVKLLPERADGLRASMTLSYAHWKNIQADLVDMRGLPYTANIGSGRIWAAEASLQWHPVPALGLTAAIFANDSRLTDADQTVTGDQSQELPNVPHLGISGKVDFRQPLKGAWQLDVTGSARYTGHSRLGPRPHLYIQQGDYVMSNATARVGTERWGMSLQVDNVFDQLGNTFALGNPFDVAAGRQIVPQRPRTIRIGIDARF